MMGFIRLVNPDRGTALAVTAGRLIATSTDYGCHWEIRVMHEGREYFTRRSLAFEEMEAIAQARRTTETPDPSRWHWRALGPMGQQHRPGHRPLDEHPVQLHAPQHSIAGDGPLLHIEAFAFLRLPHCADPDVPVNRHPARPR